MGNFKYEIVAFIPRQWFSKECTWVRKKTTEQIWLISLFYLFFTWSTFPECYRSSGVGGGGAGPPCWIMGGGVAVATLFSFI